MHTWDKELLRRLLILIVDETGISQRKLADLAGVHHAQVSRWKSGMHRPDYESMARLGAALRSGYPQLPDMTQALLAATGRGAPDAPAGDAIPDDAPLCTFEQSILTETEISDATKAQLINVHRKGKHVNCRLTTEASSAATAACL
jgi:transcriptional regulator with XRE-family HTH domain